MCEATEEHLNPIYLEAVEVDARRCRSSARPPTSSSTSASGSSSTSSPPSAAPSSTRPRSCTRTRLDRALPRAARRRRSTRRSAGTSSAMIRSPQWDERFPADKMVPALEATLADLGIDLDAQPNVHLDIEQRPQKSPRAFCSPIEVPGQGDARDPADRRRRRLARASSTRPATPSTSRTPRADLTMEEQRLGDNAVTEGWAMLLQHLTDEPGVARAPARLPAARASTRPRATIVAALLRAPLLREAPLRAGVPRRRRPRRRCRSATSSCSATRSKIEPSPANYLADIDAGFYVPSYLRSWALEAQLRDYLRSGSATSGSPRARPARSYASCGPRAQAHRGRAAERSHRRGARAGGGRGPHPRDAALAGRLAASAGRCPVYVHKLYS